MVLRRGGTMKRTMGKVELGVLVWSLSIALVSGRVSGTLRVSENGGESHVADGNVPASPLATVQSNANAVLWMNALLIVTAVLLVLAIVILLLMIRRVHLRRRNSLLPETRWRPGMKTSLPFVTTCPFLKRAELEAACEDFSNIIGSSSDGVLYKGTLADGTEVAVTSIRMSAADWSANSELSFRRKVEGLTRMKHKHLVNLVGYCSEEQPLFTRMLVFEYASNGTLSDHLHNNPKELEPLDWATRMRVVMGAAYGLEYMHHDLTPPCSHLNFDANAIYLTDEYAAKLANFGIARMVSEKRNSFDASSRCTSWMGCKVSAGYGDEWESDRHCPSFESNVYDFGVFLLQTITGRPPYLDKQGSLVNWAQEYLYDPKLMALMLDPELESHNGEELAALCKVAGMCLSSKEFNRPSMRKVSHMLAEALKMTPEAASMKASPLLWAQLSILDDTA